MSQTQTWPLSHDANKLSGTRQLHLRDGTVHLHGPRNDRCPGSNRLPINTDFTLVGPPSSTAGLPSTDCDDRCSSPSRVSQAVSQAAATPQSVNYIAAPTTPSWLNDVGSIIKHIPRSARGHCASELTSSLSKIVAAPASVDAWHVLLNFSSTMLTAPRRAGRKHHITSLLQKRSATDVVQPRDYPSKTSHRQMDKNMPLATAVTTKIEDGNIKAAIRILSSDDSLAPDCEETVNALRRRHPAAAPDRTANPDPHSFPSLAVSEKEVNEAIRSFPAGSAGGPDRFRPQHLRDLTSDPTFGPPLIAAITGFVNILLDGKCPQPIAPVLFGGNLTALTKKTGGIRPIAVGYTWRRLVAKCAMTRGLEMLGDT